MSDNKDTKERKEVSDFRKLLNDARSSLTAITEMYGQDIQDFQVLGTLNPLELKRVTNDLIALEAVCNAPLRLLEDKYFSQESSTNQNDSRSSITGMSLANSSASSTNADTKSNNDAGDRKSVQDRELVDNQDFTGMNERSAILKFRRLIRKLTVDIDQKIGESSQNLTDFMNTVKEFNPIEASRVKNDCVALNKDAEMPRSVINDKMNPKHAGAKPFK